VIRFDGLFSNHIFTAMAGYSATPLVKKLGFRDHFKVRFIDAPANYLSLLEGLPDNVLISADRYIKKNLIHCFARTAKSLMTILPELKNEIEQDGMIWISWPKKSSGLQSEITEDFIRDLALKTGLVDIKVCAVDETWSALKLVIPVKKRSGTR
jgi:hypothetical protein